MHIFLLVFSLRAFTCEWLVGFYFLFFSQLNFSLHFLFDLFSILFLSFIFLISSVVVFYRIFYIDGDSTIIRFLILLLLFVFSIAFLVVCPTLLGLVFGWDGLGVTSFLLVIYYNNFSTARSGLITIYTNRLGDIFFLLGFFFFFSLIWMGSDSFYLLDWGLFFLLILLAGFTRRAQMPFFSWLPAAIAAPTPISSLVHSSTLVTAGVYLFFRFFFLFDTSSGITFFCLVFLITSFSAGIFACIEIDLKRLVAISTLSQLGLIIFSLGICRAWASFFHLLSHALFKSLLFLRCGFIIINSLGIQDTRFIGRKVYLRAVFLLFLFVCNLSLCGFPFLNGFFSKDIIIEGVFTSDGFSFLFILFFFCCCLSILYSLKLINLVFFRGCLSASSLSSFPALKLAVLSSLFLWSISLGKIFSKTVFDGEIYIFFLLDRVMGNLFLLGLPFIYLFYSEFLSEMLWVNWFSGNFLSKCLSGLFPLLGSEGYWLPNTLFKVALSKLSARKISFFFTHSFKMTLLWVVLLLVTLIALFLPSSFSSIVLKRQSFFGSFFKNVLPLRFWKPIALAF